MNNDYEAGRDAFTYFFNASVPFTELRFNEFASQVAGGESKVQYFFDGLGLAINSIQSDGLLSNSQLKSSMENLAYQAQGKIPKRESFYSAISGQAQDFNFMQAVPTVAKETAGKILEGAQEVGNAVLDTGKSLLTVGPLVIVLCIGFYVWSKTKKLSA